MSFFGLDYLLPSTRDGNSSLSALLAFYGIFQTLIIYLGLQGLAGRALGAELIGDGALEQRQPKWWAFAVTGAAVLILCWQTVFFSWWGLAIYHKARLMKCSYEIDWREIRYEAHGRAAPDGAGAHPSPHAWGMRLKRVRVTAGRPAVATAKADGGSRFGLVTTLLPQLSVPIVGDPGRIDHQIYVERQSKGNSL